jgi:uncharacterized protein (DUF983 family)
MLLRGAFRRCAWRGGRSAFFTGWFKKSPHCQTCGLNWRRDDVGDELGAAAVAAVICFGPLILALGVVAAVTWPDLTDFVAMSDADSPTSESAVASDWQVSQLDRISCRAW